MQAAARMHKGELISLRGRAVFVDLVMQVMSIHEGSLTAFTGEVVHANRISNGLDSIGKACLGEKGQEFSQFAGPRRGR